MFVFWMIINILRLDYFKAYVFLEIRVFDYENNGIITFNKLTKSTGGFYMQRRVLYAISVLIDAALISVIPFLALYIRLEGGLDEKYVVQITDTLPVIVIVRIIAHHIFGLYNYLWRYASIHEMLMTIGAVTIGSIFIYFYTLIFEPGYPRSVQLLSWILNILIIGASRIALRTVYYVLDISHKSKEPENVLIIGAGDAGAVIARELRQRHHVNKKLKGFIDDDPNKIGLKLFGVKVLGSCKSLKEIVLALDIKEIIIAMPSVEGKIVREIIRECKETECIVKTLPGIYELIDGKVSVQQLRNVDLEDLLRRDAVNLDISEIATYLHSKCVLVTGAGGSIGSELCRQIAKVSPKKLVLLGKGENSIYEIERELIESYPRLEIVPVIADVRDKDRIQEIFEDFYPQVVFHAAAHKHVPLMEAQPIEAVRNNIFGTKNVVEAANIAKTEVFVMISTDKAVNPTSVMGATKRVAELIIQKTNSTSKTKFAVVRFGNVLGSRGSVIPLFKKQIAKGGPITITHPDMERYFMTIPEASQLVLQAGSMAKGGEVFVLDMGEPVKIVDMAKDLVELSGLVLGKDIEIKYSGLRPGEKLFEELLTAEEGTSSTKHRKIYVANIKQVDESRLITELEKLKIANASQEIKNILKELVPTYKSTGIIRN